jgi:hypothetical protein
MMCQAEWRASYSSLPVSGPAREKQVTAAPAYTTAMTFQTVMMDVLCKIR